MEKSVALKYSRGLPAPFVIGKGRGEIALRINAIARSHGVEVVRMPELADSLFVLDVGEWIPEELFEIAAEVLAFVYKVRTAR